MPTIPLDEAPRGQGRYGPFWIEEGRGLLAIGALLILAVALLYGLALVDRPGA
ncbi:MAG TPA: hypothetical protein VFO60_07875 [Candidatus Dormibacteraeota bacterium]|nr:hypothetical protein [Candidatus Dormibacteraeota bacterium]